MTPDELDVRFEAFCGLVLERLDRIEGMIGNQSLATAEDFRKLSAALQRLASNVLRHDSDIAALKGDTDPCPNANGAGE
jgi:hypothetical protein